MQRQERNKPRVSVSSVVYDAWALEYRADGGPIAIERVGLRSSANHDWTVRGERVVMAIRTHDYARIMEMDASPTIVFLAYARVRDAGDVVRKWPRSIRERVRLIVWWKSDNLGCQWGYGQNTDLVGQRIHMEDLFAWWILICWGDGRGYNLCSILQV
jgi:hypothetical protein